MCMSERRKNLESQILLPVCIMLAHLFFLPEPAGKENVRNQSAAAPRSRPVSAAAAEAQLSIARSKGEISALGTPLSRGRPAASAEVQEERDQTSLLWRWQAGRGWWTALHCPGGLEEVIQRCPGSPAAHTALTHGRGDLVTFAGWGWDCQCLTNAGKAGGGVDGLTSIADIRSSPEPRLGHISP